MSDLTKHHSPIEAMLSYEEALAEVYATCRIKPRKKSTEQMIAFKRVIYQIVRKDGPLTLRQLYYLLLTMELLYNKSRNEYAKVSRACVQMRREGWLPYSWMVDHTRWMRKPTTWDSLDEAIEYMRYTFRRSLWTHSSDYVEIWTESASLASFLGTVTEKWDVPLMVSGGYTSETFAVSAAEAIRDMDRQPYVYYFGDHDPSGLNIESTLKKKLLEHAPNVIWQKVAITPAQMIEFQVATCEPKTTDSRTKSFIGECAETEALPPAVLRQLCEECILRHVDPWVVDRIKLEEDAERETMDVILSNLRRAS